MECGLGPGVPNETGKFLCEVGFEAQGEGRMSLLEGERETCPASAGVGGRTEEDLLGAYVTGENGRYGLETAVPVLRIPERPFIGFNSLGET